MRMWNLDVRKMCNQHLLGEHVETHMFAGTINQGSSIKGYVEKGLVEVHNLRKRHDTLAKELKRRNMNHKSPLQKFKIVRLGKINTKENKKDIMSRCKKCKENFNQNEK